MDQKWEGTGPTYGWNVVEGPGKEEGGGKGLKVRMEGGKKGKNERITLLK